jgi:hypothetical protein
LLLHLASPSPIGRGYYRINNTAHTVSCLSQQYVHCCIENRIATVVVAVSQDTVISRIIYTVIASSKRTR